MPKPNRMTQGEYDALVARLKQKAIGIRELEAELRSLGPTVWPALADRRRLEEELRELVWPVLASPRNGRRYEVVKDQYRRGPPAIIGHPDRLGIQELLDDISEVHGRDITAHIRAKRLLESTMKSYELIRRQIGQAEIVEAKPKRLPSSVTPSAQGSLF